MELGKYISKDQFFEIITNYIYLKEGKSFEIVQELSIKDTKYGKIPDMKLYLEMIVDEDTPFFEGVMIYLKQKEKPFQKTFKNGK